MDDEAQANENARRILTGQQNWIAPADAQEQRAKKKENGFVQLILIVAVCAFAAFVITGMFKLGDSGLLAVWGIFTTVWVSVKWGTK